MPAALLFCPLLLCRPAGEFIELYYAGVVSLFLGECSFFAVLISLFVMAAREVGGYPKDSPLSESAFYNSIQDFFGCLVSIENVAYTCHSF